MWAREAAAGREEGSKDRPVVVVVATRKRGDSVELLVVPVTTRPPRQGDARVEMPERVRRHLGLPDERCWIVADELNRFAWPGPDVRPIRRKGEVTPFYGSIPAKLFEEVRAEIERTARAGRLQRTERTE